MKPEEVKRMEEEDEDEEFVGLNVDSNLLEIVPVLFKSESEVELFYDGFIEKVHDNKRLRKHQDNRKLMNEAFLEELLKYYDVDVINDAINGITHEEPTMDADNERDADRVLRNVFSNKNEFRMFMTHISQYMMECNDTPVEAAAKSMKRLDKSDTDILKVTSIIDKIF